MRNCSLATWIICFCRSSSIPKQHQFAFSLIRLPCNNICYSIVYQHPQSYASAFDRVRNYMLLTRCLLVMTSGQRNLAQLITVSGGCGTLGIERTVSFVRSWSQVGPRLGNVPRTRRYRRSMPDSACSGAIFREYGNDPRVSK